MNSKGIEPRVGMQVRFVSSGIEQWPKKISKITEIVRFDVRQYCWLPGQGGDWDQGNYEIEWIPPTDEERVMFADAARHYTDGTKCDGFCDWYMRRSGLHGQCVSEEIAESLALDGMDIDDVSKIEELMR